MFGFVGLYALLVLLFCVVCLVVGSLCFVICYGNCVSVVYYGVLIVLVRFCVIDGACVLYIYCLLYYVV